jgi:hypothetical protein
MGRVVTETVAEEMGWVELLRKNKERGTFSKSIIRPSQGRHGWSVSIVSVVGLPLLES